MKLLNYGDFSVVLIWDVDNTTWRVAKIFRRFPGRIEAEPCSISDLGWMWRQDIAERCDDRLP
jgi:hypothetical protein